MAVSISRHMTGTPLLCYNNIPDFKLLQISPLPSSSLVLQFIIPACDVLGKEQQTLERGLYCICHGMHTGT